MHFHLLLLSAGVTFASVASGQARFVPLVIDSRHVQISVHDGGSQILVLENLAVNGSAELTILDWTAGAGFQPFMTAPGATDFKGDTAGEKFLLTGWGAAGIWDAAGGLHRLQPPTVGASLQMVGISGDGRVAMGSSYPGIQGITHLRWISGAPPVPMQGIPNNVSFLPLAMNYDGGVCVGVSTHGPFRWSEITGFDVLVSSSNLNDKATGVSGDGTRVVGHLNTTREAFLWTAATGVRMLPMLPGMTVMLFPFISEDGTTIVGSSDMGTWLWTQATGVILLEHHLANLGVTDLQGWHLITPHSISRDGKVITGMGHQGPATAHGSAVPCVVYLDADVLGSLGLSFCGPNETNSSGLSASLFALGTEVVGSNDLTLSAQFLPPGQLGYILSSRGSAAVTHPGNSRGRLCVGGAQTIGRHNRSGEVQVADASGRFELHLDLMDMAGANGSVVIQAGETWYFQAWFRDPIPQFSSNFSDAIEITFR